MISISNKIKSIAIALICATTVLSSCNKELEQFPEAPLPTVPSYKALGDTLGTSARANDSLYYRLIVRGGVLSTLNNKATTLTLFVPTNAAMRSFITAVAAGAGIVIPPGVPDAVYSGFITTYIPVATAAAIVMYNTVPQSVSFGSLPATFPNFQYPSILNPAPQLSALLRLTTFPSIRNGNYVNNVPVISTANNAANGSFYEVAAVVVPPQQFLWDRINTDPELTYFKKAIQRGDADPASPGIQSLLSNIGANFTVFAPTDAATQQLLFGAIYQALIAQGVPPDQAFAIATTLASTPAGFDQLPTQAVLGLVLYHILFADPNIGSRAFTNNFPTTSTNYTTLLNKAVAAHPGVGLQATFTGPLVSAATVKGAANPTASVITINPFPNGSSDQHYVNGVLHKIDQALRPQ